MKEYIKNNITPILCGIIVALAICKIIDIVHDLVLYWEILANK